MHFHHVHFTTLDPPEDLAFFETFFGAMREAFCNGEDGEPLAYVKRTERVWFVYTKVDEAPDPALNTYLEHVGWVHSMPGEEFTRMIDLGVTLAVPALSGAFFQPGRLYRSLSVMETACAAIDRKSACAGCMTWR